MKNKTKKTTPQTLKGFRDFLPAEKKLRDQVSRNIIKTFESFGFEPVETPTLEYASVLLGKYGDEADKLVYTFKDKGNRKIGLRYDQTVPTARLLTQYGPQLPKFFRRYQIQNVFRADKPQKGRYREFTQCDIDIFGSTDPISDAETIACTYFSFKNLNFPTIQIKVNDRSLLFNNLKPFTTPEVNILSLIQSIDKLSKKSATQVQDELINKGLTFVNAQKALKQIKSASPTKNLKEIISLSINLGVPKANIVFEPTLARGLDYYTGMIFEVIIPEMPMGSFGGGGRYDKLINDLGGPQIPAVGIAFGFGRIIEAVKKLGLMPQPKSNAKVLITIFSPNLQGLTLKVASKLRQANINTEIYPANDNISKQLKYANQNNIPFVIIIGEDEAKNNTVTLKNMETGKQETLTLTKLLAKLR
ncbi:histidine--tRNA ligase [Patescibacteria group bacterium]|nr:histidine--tRNA ligase [Patescibacteria group bacterium]